MEESELNPETLQQWTDDLDVEADIESRYNEWLDQMEIHETDYKAHKKSREYLKNAKTKIE